jgi:hypothetical protein
MIRCLADYRLEWPGVRDDFRNWLRRSSLKLPLDEPMSGPRDEYRACVACLNLHCPNGVAACRIRSQ